MTIDKVEPISERLNRPLGRLVSILAALLTLGSIAWALDLFSQLGFAIYNEQFLSGMLALVLPLLYLTYPLRKKDPRPIPWYDLLAALLGAGAAIYISWNYNALAASVAYLPLNALVPSVIILVLVAEGLRRAAGPVLLGVLLVFFAFALWGHLIPYDQIRGRELATDDLIIGLTLDSQNLLGAPLLIGTSVVISFLFLGQILNLSGGSKFFTGIAMALMGQYRGGAAKIAVVASSLFGSISGSAVSNVLSTGVVTVPLMRRSGYTKETAGAIEAVASTGGQLMPPLMGATAFVMAEFLEVPYADIVLAAIIPAVLYYIALFVLSDLEAAKTGIERISRDKLPKAGPILRGGWFFPLPFIVLIYALFGLNLPAETAALYAAVVLIVCAMIFGYEGNRAGPGMIVRGLISTGHASIQLLLIVAAAGLVIGLLNAPGLGFALTYLLVELGAGNMTLLLILAALICIVLGMGMPTIGVYVLMAALVAPALVEVGIDKMAAHMFVFYFGMMSMITPPVAIAAFAAASLTDADPMKTGFAAVRFGWLAYAIPFLFVLSPALLMQGSWDDILIQFLFTVIGVWGISIALIGYLTRPLSIFKRGLLVAFSIAALMPPSVYPPMPIIMIIGCVLVLGQSAYELKKIGS